MKEYTYHDTLVKKGCDGLFIKQHNVVNMELFNGVFTTLKPEPYWIKIPTSESINDNQATNPQ